MLSQHFVFIIHLTPVYSSPSSGWAWLSAASNGENSFFGFGVRDPGFGENFGLEIGTCVTDKNKITFGLDLLRFKDISEKISLYGGIGLYSSSDRDSSRLGLTGSGGIWFGFDKYMLGLGYHSSKGAELKFGAGF